MFLSASTLDDLMMAVLQRLLRVRKSISTNRGDTKELTGVLLMLRNPRARLSRSTTKGTVFSCIGELLWYLSRSNELDLIKYYLPQYEKESDNGKTIYGAYGPRLFEWRRQNQKRLNQVENIIEVLKKHPSSRRAVIQLFDCLDLHGKRKSEIPCTCNLQFMVRNRRLHMLTFMRSNDAYKGLPHDVFAFTMLQEIVARTLGIEIGTYKHAVGSLHLYDSDVQKAKRYLDEGWQSTTPMPPMPPGDPWLSINEVLHAERTIRTGSINKIDLKMPGYWGDLVRLLAIFYFSKTSQKSQIRAVKRLMASKIFATYINQREIKLQPPTTPEQLEIPFSTTSEK